VLAIGANAGGFEVRPDLARRRSPEQIGAKPAGEELGEQV
jgi:hypothetical protein